jgi:hypothetical protein
LAVVLAAVPVSGLAGGDEHAEPEGHVAESAEHEAHGGPHHGLVHPNEIGLFLGSTDEPGHDAEFTWGLDYKRRVADRWAAGLIFDYAGGGLRNAIVAPSVSFWPGLGKLQLLAAAGVEFHEGREEDHAARSSSEGHGADKDATYFIVRLGLAYDIHLPKGFGIAPNINLDLVNDEEVWVWGVTLTYGF